MEAGAGAGKGKVMCNRSQNSTGEGANPQRPISLAGGNNGLARRQAQLKPTKAWEGDWLFQKNSWSLVSQR